MYQAVIDICTLSFYCFHLLVSLACQIDLHQAMYIEHLICPCSSYTPTTTPALVLQTEVEENVDGVNKVHSYHFVLCRFQLQ